MKTALLIIANTIILISAGYLRITEGSAPFYLVFPAIFSGMAIMIIVSRIFTTLKHR